MRAKYNGLMKTKMLITYLVGKDEAEAAQKFAIISYKVRVGFKKMAYVYLATSNYSQCFSMFIKYGCCRFYNNKYICLTNCYALGLPVIEKKAGLVLDMSRYSLGLNRTVV